MKSTLRIASTLVAASLATAATAGAEAPETDEEAMEAARVHFERAERYMDLEDGERAVDEYRTAYDYFPAPEFLFNIAEAYRLKGDREAAIEYYESYLEADPEGPGAAAARDGIEELRDELADDDAPADDDALADEVTSPPDDPPSAEMPGDGAPAPTPRSSGRRLRVSGLATAGLGVGFVATGAFFGRRAASISDELSDAQTFDPGRYDQGERANTTMYVMYGLGAAAITTGAVLYALGRNAGSGSRSELTISPGVAPGGAFVTASGSF